MVLPAPDGPDQRDHRARGHREGDVLQRGLAPARVGEGDAVKRDRGRLLAARPRHAGPVGDAHRLAVDRVDAPGGRERVGELAADLRDLPDRHERGHGEQGEQREHRALEPARRHEPRAHQRHREAAEPGGHFLERRLAREVGEEGHARARVGHGARGERLAALRLLLERDDLAEPLHGVHRVRVQLAGGFAGTRAEPIDARAPEQRAQRRVGQERQDGQRHRPPEGGEGGEHHRGHQHRDQARRDGVGEEVLDQLDVVGGHAEQIAGPPRGQVGRAQLHELAEEAHAHVGEQPVRHVVGEPGLEPVQHAGQRRDDQERHEPRAGRLAAAHRADHQRAQQPDADQRGHPRHAQPERDDEPPVIARGHRDQDAAHLPPARARRPEDRGGLRGRRARRRVAGRGRVIGSPRPPRRRGRRRSRRRRGPRPGPP